MNFGDRKMQMSSEAVPPIRTSPISPRLAQRLGHNLQADAARALDQHDVAGLPRSRASRPRPPLGPPRAPRPRNGRPSRPPAGPRSCSTWTRGTPRRRRPGGGARARRCPARACRRARRRGAARAPAGKGRRGRRASRGDGVEAVVDDDRAARKLSRARRGAPKKRTSMRPSGRTPTARAAATAASVLRRLCARGERQVEDEVVAPRANRVGGIRVCGERWCGARGSSSTSPPDPNVTTFRAPARSQRPSRSSPAGNDGRRRRRADRRAARSLAWGDPLQEPDLLDVHRPDRP